MSITRGDINAKVALYAQEDDLADADMPNYYNQTKQSKDSSQPLSAASNALPESSVHRNESGNSAIDEEHTDPHALQYTVDDTPPWYLCIILGFQQYLIMFGGTLANPLALSAYFCIQDNNLAKSQLIGTIFFCSGIATLLQTTFGVRLPIVQGGTFTFVTPSIAILSLAKWKCPDTSVTTTTSCPAVGLETTTVMYAVNITNATADIGLTWEDRIREIQGAIMVASIFEVIIGFSGIMGFVLRWIGPLSIAPTIALAGLSLFTVAGNFAASQWWISLTTVFLIAMFSQYTKNIGIPCARYERGVGCTRAKFPLFRLFPVILAISITWILCLILTETGVFAEDGWGSSAKTNLRIDVLQEAPWFRVPYPGQWGVPTISLSSVLGILAGVVTSMIESVGDYYACARISSSPPPPMHAVNRGIGMEGIACIIAGAIGSGSGTTSYSENIGAIGITKVASRRVIQVGALMMLFFGVFGKFGALFVTIPDPIMGGVFIVMFGMITAVGISNLQFVDLNSSRNLFIIGFSFFFGMTLPSKLAADGSSINTGSLVFDQTLTVLFRTSMFVGGLSAFILDNTIPGTDEERGLIKWREQLITRKRSKRSPELPEVPEHQIYDIPLITNSLHRMRWTRWIPFLPTFDEDLLPFRSSDKMKTKKKKNKKGQKRKADAEQAV